MGRGQGRRWLLDVVVRGSGGASGADAGEFGHNIVENWEAVRVWIHCRERRETRAELEKERKRKY